MKKLLIFVAVMAIITGCKDERAINQGSMKMIQHIDVIIQKQINTAKTEKEKVEKMEYLIGVLKNYISVSKSGKFSKELFPSIK